MTGLWIIIAAAAAGAAGYLAGQVLGYKAGHAAGRAQESARRSLRDLNDRERARTAPPPPPRQYPDDPFWDQAAPHLRYMVPRRTADPPPVVTADDIAPVKVPEPKLTDSGELERIREIGEAGRASLGLTGSLEAAP